MKDTEVKKEGRKMSGFFLSTGTVFILSLSDIPQMYELYLSLEVSQEILSSSV